MIKVSMVIDNITRELNIYQPIKPIESTRSAVLKWSGETGLKKAEHSGEWDEYQHIEFYIDGNFVGAIWEE